MESTVYANEQPQLERETAVIYSKISGQHQTATTDDISLTKSNYSRFYSSETTSSKADSGLEELEASSEHKYSSGTFTAEQTASSSISDVKEDGGGHSWFVSGNKEFESSMRLDFRSPDIEDNEKALKSELFHIFERERMTMEQYFKNRMEELLISFRSKQQEWDARSKAERAELEDSMGQEKLEMQKNFGEEVAKLTRTFNEERCQLEQYYKVQMKELRNQLRQEQQEINETVAKEKVVLKEKLETEYQTMLRVALSDSKQLQYNEKAELECEFNKIKLDMEKQHNIELLEKEGKLQKIKAEIEYQFSQEKTRMEKEFKEQQQELENKLQQEKELRQEDKRLLEIERSNSIHANMLHKEEIESLKLEIVKLRYQLDERDKNVLEIKKLEESILTRGKDGLPTKLKEDFDKLLSQHKKEMEKSYQDDREALELNLERRLQTERQKYEEENLHNIKKIREEINRERENSRKEFETAIRKQFDDEKSLLEEQLRIYKETETEQVKDEYNLHRVNIQSQYIEKQLHSVSTEEHISSITQADHLDTQHSILPLSSSSDSHVPVSSARLDILQSDDDSDLYNSHPSGQSFPRQINSTSHDEDVGNVLSCVMPPGSSTSGTSARFTIEDRIDPQHRHSDTTLCDEDQQVNCLNHLDERISLKRDKNMFIEDASRDLLCVSAEGDDSLIVEINKLRRENEGLKAKVKALEENIELHKIYKAEIKSELDRLEKKNVELLEILKKMTNNDDERPLRDADLQNGGNEQQETGYFERFKESEHKTQTLDKNAWDAEIKLKEWEKRARKAEENVQDLQNKLRKTEEERRSHQPRHRDGVLLRGAVDKDSDFRTRSKLKRMSEKDKEKVLIAFINGDIRKVHHSDKKSERQDLLERRNSDNKHYKEKRELTHMEKEKLLQSVKYLQQQVKALEDNQHKHDLSNIETSHEENEEMSGFLSTNLCEIHRKLQTLEQRLQQENEMVLSSSKSKYLLEIKELQSQIDEMGRAVKSHGGSSRLDVEILRRIEKELVSISQFIKGFLFRDNEAYTEYPPQRSDCTSRVMHLELDKQELEFKLKMAKDAMSDYVVRLNEKMTDLEASGNMSESMLEELRTRNRNLKKTIQALEDGQKKSQLQNEQLLQQKSTLQEMIGKLCTDGDSTSCASLQVQPGPVPHDAENAHLGFST